MVRRDEIIEKFGIFNSTATINNLISDLEKYIDEELQKESNIKKWINLSNIGSTMQGDLELVNKKNITDDVHRDLTIKGGTKITVENGTDVLAYTIFEKGITDQYNRSATETPWSDRTIAQGEFNGVLSIQCPENTNKNVAKALAEKYLAIDKKNENGENIGGYWSKAIKPNISGNYSDGVILNDAVTVTYNKEKNLVYLNFKLF